MDRTPDKNALNTSTSSPVRSNARTPLTPLKMKNEADGMRIKCKAIAKTLLENHRKWEAAHRRGITLCKSIEKCKSHAIKTFNDNNVDPADKTLYPTELKPNCDKLQVITTIFEDVRNSAKESCDRSRTPSLLLQLAQPNAVDDQLVFRTWTCKTFQETVDKIHDAYVKEYEMKIKVMQNIAHSKSDDELAMHLAAWEHQTHVNSGVDMLFKALIIEADIELDDKTKPTVHN